MDEIKDEVVQEEQKTLGLEDVIATLKEAGVEDIEGALKGLYDELEAHFNKPNEEETEEEAKNRLFGE